jgi:hypothetical protein
MLASDNRVSDADGWVGRTGITEGKPPMRESAKTSDIGWPAGWPRRRTWNIAFRTLHIVAAGALFGGHVFDVPPDRLLGWLLLTLATGAVLILLEAYPHIHWCYEARGVMTLAKLALMASIPWLWEYRAAILVVVIVLASVGSHMPRKWRHFSLVHRRVLDS